MNIREEEPKDRDEVYAVVREAFAAAAHADGNEQELVCALRGSAAFIPALSLVAEADGKIVGHVLFTRATVGETAVLALAPLAVLPAYQRQGVGTALVQAGHRIARQLGYGYAIVLGSLDYYQRFGYIPADSFGIRAPFDVPRENFMVCRLLADAPPVCGVMAYAAEFGI